MLVRWNPFTEIDRLFKDIDETIWGTVPQWKPIVDVREEDNTIIVDAELPGMTEDDVKVSVESNVLTISGERKAEKKEKYHRTERYRGSFARSFTLPTSAEADKIEASFDKGVLTVKIPNKTPPAPREIEIKGPTRRSLGSKKT
jgi:HSP20 family protein